MIDNIEDMSIEYIVEMFYNYQYDPDNLEVFYFNLIGAIKTANKKNMKRLNIIFPNFVYVYKLWSASGAFGDELFKKYGIGKFSKDQIIDV